MQPVTVVDASSEPPFAGSWHDFGLAPGLAEAIRTHKGEGKFIEQVSTIQRELIKAPRDASVYATSSTGSGKSLAVFAPVLDDMLKGRSKSALVLAITNTLIDQHVMTIHPLVDKLPKRVSVMKVDSKAANRVVQAAKQGPIMLFSTPHQILELSQKFLEFKRLIETLDCVAIDEVDGVVADPTFGRQVSAVMDAAPRARLIAVTATHTDAALAKVRAMAHQPVLHIVAGKVHRAVIAHTAVVTEAKGVLPILAMILARERDEKVMVFSSSGGFTELAFAYCVGAGIQNATRVYPKLSDGIKKAVQREFQTCTRCVVFCTDSMGRGMDFEGVTLVIQIGYTAPDLYMQRAGRSGRGLVATGRSVLLVAEQERASMRVIAGSRGVEFKEVRVVPDRRPSVAVPDQVVRKAYKAFLGAYKGVMKNLGWRDADVFKVIGDIVKGAGFKEPVLEAKDVKKVGLSLPKLDHGPQGRQG